MKTLVRIGLGGCAVAALLLVAGTPAEAARRCSKVSAQGAGLGEAMAKQTAKSNLDSGLASKGMKARGKVAYACSGMVLSNCTASQRAC
jgi:hypothetical protein